MTANVYNVDISNPKNSDDTPSSSEKCPICQKDAGKICSGCLSIFYCSFDHQKQHWKDHKESCRPYIIKRNDMYGRYLIASRDLPQGTIVMTEGPLLVGPKRITHPVCLGCHQFIDCSYHCSKCTFPLCSEACENNPNHAENECPIFQKGHPIGSKITSSSVLHPAYEAVTTLRCLLLKDRDPTKWAKLNTMEHHNDFRRSLTSLWNRNEVNTVKLIRDWYKLKEEFDSETVHSCIGFIDVNCFEIKYKNIEICGLYPEASLISHNCNPNTHRATTSGPHFQMIVRTSVPIRKGEIISTSYVSALKGTVERRDFLKETKYFDCHCKRCKDPTEFGSFISAIKCQACQSGYLLPQNPVDKSTLEQLDSALWSCTSAIVGGVSCPNTVKYEKLRASLIKIRKEIASAEQCTVGSRVSRLERVLKKLSGKLLHPNHYLLLDVIESLIRLYFEDMDVATLVSGTDILMLERKRELCLQILNILDLIDPGLSRDRGVTLQHLFQVDYVISKIKFQQGNLKAEDFLKKCDEMLAYLRTAKETLELDRLIVDIPLLALSVDKSIDLIYAEISFVTENEKNKIV